MFYLINCGICTKQKIELLSHDLILYIKFSHLRMCWRYKSFLRWFLPNTLRSKSFSLSLIVFALFDKVRDLHKTGNRMIVMWSNILLSLSVSHWPSMRKDFKKSKNLKYQKYQKSHKKSKKSKKSKKIKSLIIWFNQSSLHFILVVFVFFNALRH